MKQVFLLWVLLAALYFDVASASSLGVWPINPRIDAPASAVMIWAKNNNKNESVILQARVFLWRQNDNKDQLIPQDDLVVSPPLIEVKADAQQIFRVMNRQGVIANTAEEKSYRILIDEVPKESKTQESLLRFQMRYSLPLFVGIPDDIAKLSLTDQLKKLSIGLNYRVVKTPEPFIEIYNNNVAHVRLSNVKIGNAQTPDKTVMISAGLLGYILPHTTRRWPLTPEQLNAMDQKEAFIKFEQEHQELSIVAEK